MSAPANTETLLRTKMAQQTSWTSLVAKLQSFQPPTIEDLQRYSAANLDPWTIQLGQVLCDRFQFAPLGHRNLGSILSSLPEEQAGISLFEVGYGPQHVLHVLLRSSEGVCLAAMVGVLAEYFHEDFVIDFFSALANLSQVPLRLRPLETQWRRMVRVLYGVLATSNFGQVLKTAEDFEINVGKSVDLHGTLRALETMSQAVQKKEKSVSVVCGADFPFLVAVSTWLFDLKYVATAGEKTIHASPGLGSQSEADIVFKLSDAGSNTASLTADTAPRYHYPVDMYVVGGRVPFERLFKLTFGTIFTSVKDDTISTYLGCAAKMMHDHLDSIGKSSEFAFLPHDIGLKSGPGFGFIETMVGWFPELRRLSPRFERLSKLSISEAQAKFTEAVAKLKDGCRCSTCNSTSSEPQEVCSVLVMELILSLGVYVTRMIVQPGLYPKAKGIWTLLKRIQDAQVTTVEKPDPVEDFMQRIGRHLPTAVEMLKMGAMLFSNSASKEIDAQANLMGLTHAGLIIFLNGGFKGIASDKASDRDRNPTTIRVGSGWMCVLGHEVTLEVFSPSPTGWSFDQAWEAVRLGHETRQIFKWQGPLLLTRMMPPDEKEEAQVVAQGWFSTG